MIASIFAANLYVEILIAKLDLNEANIGVLNRPFAKRHAKGDDNQVTVGLAQLFKFLRIVFFKLDKEFVGIRICLQIVSGFLCYSFGHMCDS